MKFNLKVIQPYRGIFVFPIALFGCFFASFQISSRVSNTAINIMLIVVACVFVIGCGFFLMYGRLVIHVEHEALNIKWIRKIPFDFNKTKTIAFEDITKFRIDRLNGQAALKIYYNYPGADTRTHSFYINSYDNKLFRGDILNLMDYLTELSKVKSIKLTDDWEEWHEKGYLKIAYRINQAITTIALLVIIYTVFTGRFKVRNLLFTLSFLPQMYLYGQFMKGKIRRDKT